MYVVTDSRHAACKFKYFGVVQLFSALAVPQQYAQGALSMAQHEVRGIIETPQQGRK
jgi:hypothetical protein